MFHSLVSLFTTAALLLHSIFGCCTHHAHVCGHGHQIELCAGELCAGELCAGAVNRTVVAPAAGHVSASQPADGHGVLSPAAGSGRLDRHSERCPHEPCGLNCSGNECAFVPPFKVRTPSRDDVVAWNPVAGVASLQTMATGVRSGSNSSVGPSVCAPGGACRAMTQIWLL